MDLKIILVTGANGQLGREIKDISERFPQYKFVFTNRNDLDVAELDSVEKIVNIHPDYIIHCAAYTAVDKAELESELANQNNVEACKHLVAAAAKCQATLIHFSSDYVYHLVKKGPLIESDPVSPQSVYAKTKRASEEVVSTLHKHIILRTSWVYSKYGNNFVNTMLRLAETKKELTIVGDQIGSPTYAGDLANATMKIITALDTRHNVETRYGIYNYSNEGTLSWFDFAHAIFELKGIPMVLSKTTTAEYNAPAPRPLWSLMSKNKIKRTFGVDVPHWREALKRCLDVK